MIFLLIELNELNKLINLPGLGCLCLSIQYIQVYTIRILNKAMSFVVQIKKKTKIFLSIV